jgi:cytochrome c oxidase subunit IV
VAHDAPETSASKDGHEAHGTGRYYLVWGLLLCFTALTVFTGRLDLGGANLPIALLIATVKATLVVLFFMHMTEAPGANRLVFVVSLLFSIVLLVGVFGDLWTRNAMSLPPQAPTQESIER